MLIIEEMIIEEITGICTVLYLGNTTLTKEKKNAINFSERHKRFF